jgi:hypothetical protein
MMDFISSFLPPRHILITISRGLFLLLAVIWTILTLLSLLRPPSGMSTGGLWVMVALMAGNVGALLISAWGLGRGNRWLNRFAVAVASANLILSVTDEFGPLDLLSFLLDALLLLLLLAARTTRAEQESPRSP